MELALPRNNKSKTLEKKKRENITGFIEEGDAVSKSTIQMKCM